MNTEPPHLQLTRLLINKYVSNQLHIETLRVASSLWEFKGIS